METQQQQKEVKPYNPVRRKGRPPLLDIERRVGKIQTGFTISEFKSLSEKAETLGISEAEYVRAAALGRELKSVSKINKEAYFELQKIGSNVNQIAKELNSRGSVKSFDSLSKLAATISEIRKQLLGVQ